MTAEELVNLSLYKIGVSKSIASIDENTREAITAKALFNHQLRATLRQHPWGFATKYLELTLVQGPAWDATAAVQAWSAGATYVVGDIIDLAGTRYYASVAGLNQLPPNAAYWSTTATRYANGDWTYAYRWPVDCLFARRFVSSAGTGRTFDPIPIRFRVGRDANGLLLYTAERAAVLEYTCLDCDALWADDLFIDAFTWRLGGAMAPSLSQLDKMAATCWQMYLVTLRSAAAVSSNEAQLEPGGEASWIRDRG
jgi:hypothetical protein